MQQFFCNCWRECPICLEKRADKLRLRIERAIMEDSTVRLIKGSKEEVDLVASLVSKESILRCPVTGEVEWAFISDSDNLAELAEYPVLDLEQIQAMDWLLIAKTPDGRRTSGSLGLTTSVAAKSTGETIVVEAILSDASPELEQAAIRWSCDQSPELDPHTVAELQAAFERRSQLYKEYLVANGAKIRHIQKRTVKAEPVESLNWAGRRSYES